MLLAVHFRKASKIDTGRRAARSRRFLTYPRTTPCTFFSGSWRVVRGLEHDAERSEAKCFEPRCVLSIAVTSGTEPTCRERPSAPCVSDSGGTCAPTGGRGGCPVGSPRLRAPVQGTATIAAAPCQRGTSEWRMNATGSWASIGHPRRITFACRMPKAVKSASGPLRMVAKGWLRWWPGP